MRKQYTKVVQKLLEEEKTQTQIASEFDILDYSYKEKQKWLITQKMPDTILH